MSSEIELKVFCSVDEVGKESIDTIADDPFFTYGWLKTLETQHTYHVSPIYFVFYHEKKIVGFVPSFIELVDPNSRDSFSRLLNLGHRIGFCQNRVLRIHSPHCLRSRILLSENQDEKLMLELLLKKINVICKEQKILFSFFPYVSEFDRLLISNLGNSSFLKFPRVKTFFLDVCWNSFEDYLKSLKTHVRSNVTREIRKCVEQGVDIQESELEDHAEELSELYTNLSLKYYKNAKQIFDHYFFNMLNTYTKDRIKLFLAKKNDEVLGFSLSFRYGEVLDVMMTGFNYAKRTNKDFSYFNLCYYAPIRYAIENGVKKIYYRNTMEKIKLDRGCKTEQVFLYVKCQNKPLATLISTVLKNPLYPFVRSRLHT